MEDEEVTQGDLQDILDDGEAEFYVGGTSKLNEAGLEAYLSTKTLTEKDTGDEVFAEDAFEYVYWAKTSSANSAETKLLCLCDDDQCPYNQHTVSNLPKRARGIIYILTDTEFSAS